MVLVVNGVTGRGEFTYISNPGQPVYAIRAVCSGLPDIGIDFSNRRNPTWYSLGHLSLSYQFGTVVWESWLNYLDQSWYTSDFIQGILILGAGVGLPSQGIDENGETVFTLRWQMRSQISLSCWLANGVVDNGG